MSDHHVLVMGNNATVIGSYSIALGHNVHASNGQIVIGPQAKLRDMKFPDVFWNTSQVTQVMMEIRQAYICGEWEVNLRDHEKHHGMEAIKPVRKWLDVYFNVERMDDL